MGIKILAVDDESSANFMIKQMFRRQIRAGEYELFFADNGQEALDILSGNAEICIVLTDINMPEMDGLELLETIYEKYPQLMVIMVSAYSDMPRIRHAMNYRAFDYLTKPVDAKDLRETVAKALGFIERNQK